MGILSKLKAGVKAVASVGQKVLGNPVLQTVAGFVPGGSVAVKIASKVVNSPVLKAVLPASKPKGAPVVVPSPLALKGNKVPAPSASVKNSPAKKPGAMVAAYAAMTERMKHGRK